MHPILRRTALAATALLFASSAALAQANGWPKQPITLIMGFPAGSGVDVVARAVQEPLGQKLGQPIVIDYKSGAAGNIASEYVAHAKPDGYTLAFGTAATHGSNAALYKSLPFDVEADFVPVGPLIDVSNVLTINPSVIDARNLKEFVDYAKKKVRPASHGFSFALACRGQRDRQSTTIVLVAFLAHEALFDERRDGVARRGGGEHAACGILHQTVYMVHIRLWYAWLGPANPPNRCARLNLCFWLIISRSL